MKKDFAPEQLDELKEEVFAAVDDYGDTLIKIARKYSLSIKCVSDLAFLYLFEIQLGFRKAGKEDDVTDLFEVLGRAVEIVMKGETDDED